MCEEIEGFQEKGKDFGEECRFGEDEQNLGQALLAPNDEKKREELGSKRVILRVRDGGGRVFGKSLGLRKKGGGLLAWWKEEDEELGRLKGSFQQKEAPERFDQKLQVYPRVDPGGRLMAQRNSEK